MKNLTPTQVVNRLSMFNLLINYVPDNLTENELEQLAYIHSLLESQKQYFYKNQKRKIT